MTLVLTRPASMDVVRMSGYNAANTLQVFQRADGNVWAAPYLATAGKCGIRSTVVLYPIRPDRVKCADVLEVVSALAVNYRMTFMFMFPMLRADPERADAEYVPAFMEKVHKYFDCTPHTCGICFSDCDVCSGAPASTEKHVTCIGNYVTRQENL